MSRVALILLSLVALQAAAGGKPELKPGDKPPLHVGRQLDGADVDLDPASGKAYVISYWATWCEPCMQELPILSNIQRTIGPDKMQVVAVNVEDRAVYRRIERLIRETGVTPAWDANDLSQDAFGVHGIPHLVIIGRDGRISAVRKAYDQPTLKDLAAEVNKALATPPKPATPTELVRNR